MCILFILFCLLISFIYWFFAVLIHEFGHYFISKICAKLYNIKFYNLKLVIGYKDDDGNIVETLICKLGFVRIMDGNKWFSGYFDCSFFYLLANDNMININKKKSIIRWCIAGGIISMLLIAIPIITFLITLKENYFNFFNHSFLFNFICYFIISFPVIRIIASIINKSKTSDLKYFINPELFINDHKRQNDK